MDNKDEIISFNLLLNHIIDVLEQHTQKFDVIMNNCVNKTDCHRTHDAMLKLNDELKQKLAAIHKNIDDYSTNFIILKEKFNAHENNHEKKWKWVALISGLIGILGMILGLWERYFSKMFK